MVFRMGERDDGDFELELDEEGLNYLEDGLTELRHMPEGEAICSPSITSDGVSSFILKRAQDA